MFYQLLPELNYQIVEATKNEPTAAEKNAAQMAGKSIVAGAYTALG